MWVPPATAAVTLNPLYRTAGEQRQSVLSQAADTAEPPAQPEGSSMQGHHQGHPPQQQQPDLRPGPVAAAGTHLGRLKGQGQRAQAEAAAPAAGPPAAHPAPKPQGILAEHMARLEAAKRKAVALRSEAVPPAAGGTSSDASSAPAPGSAAPGPGSAAGPLGQSPRPAAALPRGQARMVALPHLQGKPADQKAIAMAAGSTPSGPTPPTPEQQAPAPSPAAQGVMGNYMATLEAARRLQAQPLQDAGAVPLKITPRSAAASPVPEEPAKPDSGTPEGPAVATEGKGRRRLGAAMSSQLANLARVAANLKELAGRVEESPAASAAGGASGAPGGHLTAATAGADTGNGAQLSHAGSAAPGVRATSAGTQRSVSPSAMLNRVASEGVLARGLSTLAPGKPSAAADSTVRQQLLSVPAAELSRVSAQDNNWVGGSLTPPEYWSAGAQEKRLGLPVVPADDEPQSRASSITGAVRPRRRRLQPDTAAPGSPAAAQQDMCIDQSSVSNLSPRLMTVLPDSLQPYMSSHQSSLSTSLKRASSQTKT